MIKIEFEINRDGHKFKDAIVLENNHQISEEQIEEMKEKRFQDYLFSIIPKEKKEINEVENNNQLPEVQIEEIKEINEGEI